jgi:competence protein ComEA
VERLLKLVRAARESAWASLVPRAALALCALLLLAWVGATATSAAPALAVATDAMHAPDAAAAMPAASGVTSPDPPPQCAPVATATAASAGPRTRASPDDPVVLNHATADDLKRLPGCGDKRAAAILALRARLGSFSRVEQLLRVKGVGRTTLRKWRPLLRLDAPATAGADAGADANTGGGPGR